MAFLHMSPLVVVVVVALFAITVYKQVNTYLTRRKFELEHGCKPLQNFYPHKDPIFGIDGMLAAMKAAKETRLLQYA